MKVFLAISLFFFTAAASAQNNKRPEVPAALPKVTVTLGEIKGGNITPDMLSRIIDSALAVRDDKGNLYTIIRFRSIYKFKSNYEDPQTGERKTTDDMRISEYTGTAVMSNLWRQSIKDNVANGDQMILDNVIVQLKNGTKMMTPAITFTVIP